MLRPLVRVWLAAVALFGCLIAPAVADPVVNRIGVPQYGTMNWDLEVMKRMGFAEREGVRLAGTSLAIAGCLAVFFVLAVCAYDPQRGMLKRTGGRPG